MDLGDNIRNKLNKDFICILGVIIKRKPTILCVISNNLLSMFHAGNIVKELGAMIKGGGGGKANIATAGGKSPDLLLDTLEYAKDLINKKIKYEQK